MKDTSPRQRRWLILLLVALSAAALAVGLFCAGCLYLPTLVSKHLPVEQIRRLGFVDFSGRVTRIGPYQAAGGPFLFGQADGPAIAIQSVVLDYSPWGLRRRTIRRVRIRDVTVNVAVDSRGLALSGIQPATDASGDTASRPQVAGIPPGTDLTVEAIEVRSGMLVMTGDGTTVRIPFDADLIPEGAGFTRLSAEVRLYPGDQPVVLAARSDSGGEWVDLRLDGRKVNLDRLAGLLGRIVGLDVAGQAALQASARLRLVPLTISDVNLNLAWMDGHVSHGPVAIAPGGEGTPAVFSVISADAANWQVRADGLQVLAPVPVTIQALTANLAVGNAQRSATVEVATAVQPFAFICPAPVTVVDRLPVAMAVEFSQTAGGLWTATLAASTDTPDGMAQALNAVLGDASIHVSAPRLNIQAQGNGPVGTVHWQLEGQAIRASAAGATIDAPSTGGAGELQFDLQASERRWRGHARLQLAAPTIGGHGLAGKLGQVETSAHFQQAQDDVLTIDGRLRVVGGRIQHQPSAVHLTGVHLDLPYRSPAVARPDQGTLSVDQIGHDRRNLGKLRGGVLLQRDVYIVSAAIDSPLLPRLRATVDGRFQTDGSGLPRGTLSFSVPAYTLPSDADLTSLAPTAKGVALSGTVSVHGKAAILSTGVRGELDLAMQDGMLRVPQRQVEVTGIEAQLHFPELPRIRSAPAQTIRFARAAMGGIVVDGGSFDLQVESEKTLFVEKGRFAWCGGKVDVQSLRLSTDKQDYQLSLYCQRLGLSRILEQLGAVNARGTGTVNGRIPISYNKGGIRFDDGFLFSTPGETGEIQLTGTEILTRGIPANTPQFAQIELAREALKDYAYDWAKLGLVSEGEDFVMRLQFDGKPAKPLPFVYNKSIGGFVRVEAGAQGSVFQGIGLDVNLRLPLNRLLQYKDIVNLME